MKHQGTEILLQLSLVTASWKVAAWEGWNTSQILGQGVLSNFWMFISISESCVPKFARRGIWSFNDSLRCTFSSLRVKRHLEKSQQLGSYVQVPLQLFFFQAKSLPPFSFFSCLDTGISMKLLSFLHLQESQRVPWVRRTWFIFYSFPDSYRQPIFVSWSSLCNLDVKQDSYIPKTWGSNHPSFFVSRAHWWVCAWAHARVHACVFMHLETRG